MKIVQASALVSVVVMAAACGQASGSDGTGGTFDDRDGSAACTPGEGITCTCADGHAGTRTCSVEGTLDACSCGVLTPVDASTPAVCGDGVCAKSESCTLCPRDCGECPKCELAPSCSDGLALPSQPKKIEFDDLAKPLSATNDGGPLPANSCLDAQLRMRIARVEVGHQAKQVWLPTGTVSGSPQSYYCVVQASDGVIVANHDAGTNGTMEVALTRPTARIPDFDGADFAPADSIFWGQQGPRATRNNLTITYSCFQQKDTGDATWQKVLDAAAKAAGGLAGSGPYGWAFGLGSIGLEVASAAVAAGQSQGDWHMFDVTQTIDKSRLLDLTNGRRWSFTRSGGESAFHYPWSLTVVVESWGCADALPSKPK
jgi:hypothetical protein